MFLNDSAMSQRLPSCFFWIAATWSGVIFLSAGMFFAHADMRLPDMQRVFESSSFHCQDICTSGVIPIVSGYTTLALEWEPSTKVLVRFLQNGRWSAWQSGSEEVDVPDEESANPYFLFSLQNSTAFQLQTLESSPYVKSTFFSVPPLRKEGVRMSVEQPSVSPSMPIIRRVDWLDASVELSAERRQELWPSEYEQIEKIIVHHTATEIRDVSGDGAINQQDYRELVRAIYYYHANVRRWGDIGYNYIIDPDGTIYEGRYGGDGVVAGHAWRGKACTKFGASDIGFNRGTIGIAFLGTFDAVAPTVQAYEALTNLITQKAWGFSVAPNGASKFQDRVYPNIVGHRDVDCTDCPGEQVAATLSNTVQLAQAKYDQYSFATPRTFAAQRIESTAPVKAFPGETREVLLRFKNNGSVTWRNYGKEKIAVASADSMRHLARLPSDGALSMASAQKEEVKPSSFTVGELLEPNVAPGEVGTFRVRMQPDQKELIHREQIVLAASEKGWMAGSESEVTIMNAGLEYAALLSTPSMRIFDSTKSPLTVVFENQGTKEWTRGDVLLSIRNEREVKSSLKHSSWKQNDGRFSFQEKIVKPGERATFVFDGFAKDIGDLRQRLELIRKKEKISGSDYAPLTVSVVPSFSAEVVSLDAPIAVLNNWRPLMTVRLKNTGGTAWKNAELRMTGNTKNGKSIYYHSSWSGKTVIGKTTTIKPGESVTFLFNITPPQKAGTYDFQFEIKQGGSQIYISSPDNSYQKSFSRQMRIDEPKKK
jgi:hypothetical protein